MTNGKQITIRGGRMEDKMSEVFKFENGDVVEDSITGFRGVVVSRTNFAAGSNTYNVRPKNTKTDGTEIPAVQVVNEIWLTATAENPVGFTPAIKQS